MTDFVETEQVALLGLALAIGLLIGIERGWRSRERKEGSRIAGLRTYGLTGLLGGGSGVLSLHLGMTVFGLIFLGFAALVAVAYAMKWRADGDASITSSVTMLLTFILGAMAILEHASLAVSAAVVTAILLRYKDVLHGWLKGLEEQELRAALQLLLISVVLLPILPDVGYGPWLALNPYEIWWMVVLIAGTSFIGYFAMKIGGAERGVFLTSLAAGMVSSTALTLHYARLSRKEKNMQSLLTSGILVACGTMFPRILLISSLINPVLFFELVVPMSVMTILTFLSAVLIWRNGVDDAEGNVFTHVVNPLELKPALFFGILLVLVILLGNASVHYFGEAGLYVFAALSGIADVDPINLTLSRMSVDNLPQEVAVFGIVLAASSNTLLKAMLAAFVSDFSVGLKVLLPLLLVSGAGLSIAWLM